MSTVEYWESEVGSFRSRITADVAKARWLLRGLAVVASETIRANPERAAEVQQAFNECLALVQDKGVVVATGKWLREHASPEVAAAAERFLGWDMSDPPADDEDWPMDDINEANRIGDVLGGIIREEFLKKQKMN